MFKRFFIILFLLISIWVIYFQHSVVYGSDKVNLFVKDVNLYDFFKTSYAEFFFVKDENPVYVWNNKIFENYSDYCDGIKQNCIIFPHQQLYSSIMWIWSIQYIWSVIDVSKARYFYNVLDNLTNLSPYWNYPYSFWALLLPINKNDENVSKDIRTKSHFDAVNIWEKWKKYVCDKNKIEKILSLSNEDYFKNLYEKWNTLFNPCETSDIANYLWFDYFFYLSNWEKSSQNYKIWSYNEDSPKSSSSMVAIVSWKWWDHKKSMQIWFSKFLYLQEKITKSSSKDEIELYNEQSKESLNKSVFELQLDIIQSSDKLVENEKTCYHNFECLLSRWYIKNQLDTRIKQCSEFFYNDEIFTKFDYSKKEKYLNNMDCFVLIYAIKSKFIEINWNITYPFKDKFPDLEFTFDDEFGDWRVLNKLK